MKEVFVKLYSVKKNEIPTFLSHYFNHPIQLENELEWSHQFQNPIEIADLISTLMDNNDQYAISAWISLDEGLSIQVTNDNLDSIIRYLYERYPY